MHQASLVLLSCPHPLPLLPRHRNQASPGIRLSEAGHHPRVAPKVRCELSHEATFITRQTSTRLRPGELTTLLALLLVASPGGDVLEQLFEDLRPLRARDLPPARVRPRRQRPLNNPSARTTTGLEQLT
jgi:hypothetical protein